MNFKVAEDVEDLLDILRETGFHWVAAEVQNVIKEGKAIDKPVARPNSTSMKNPLIETATVEFTDDEQLAIALASIREYTVNTASILRVLQKEIAEPLKETDMVIQIISDEDAELATISPDSIDRILAAPVVDWLAILDRNLEESWPSSQGRFGFRDRDSERQAE